MGKFSKRHGYAPPDKPISVRNEAPDELRSVIVDIAYESELTPRQVRSIICHVLRRRGDSDDSWSFPNIDREVRGLVDECEWYEVYDIIEALSVQVYDPEAFEMKINEYMRKRGIGWQLISGEIMTRGEESFEEIVNSALDELDASGRTTARREMHEAIQDLSRRPEPDITGSLQHTFVALECVLRDVAGESKETLGALLKERPGLIPSPIDKAVQKMWGFASNQGRHLHEGKVSNWEEAALCVHASAAVVEYLCRKYST